jgi:hypothetical protein
MTKIEIPEKVTEELSAQTAKRNGGKPRSREKVRDTGQRQKRLDGNLNAVTRNLHQVLSVAKEREDYGLALETVDRLLKVAELESRRLEESSKEGEG